MDNENAPVGGEEPTKIEEVSKVDEPVTPTIEEEHDDDEDLSEYGVPPMPTDEEESEEEEKEQETKPEENKTEIKEGEQQKEDEENVEQEEEIELPPITPPERAPSRLDKRFTKVYLRNVMIAGEENPPTEEEIIEQLAQYSMEEKIQGLQTHLKEYKKLRGDETEDEDVLGEEDQQVINDAAREEMRQEILEEEHEKTVMNNFVDFVNSHHEIDEDHKEFNPKITNAVRALWQGGMLIDEAYDTVVNSIASVQAEDEKKAEIHKQKLLSGSVTASNDLTKGQKNMTWTEFDKLRTEDPAKYEKLLDEGYEPIDE